MTNYAQPRANYTYPRGKYIAICSWRWWCRQWFRVWPKSTWCWSISFCQSLHWASCPGQDQRRSRSMGDCWGGTGSMFRFGIWESLGWVCFYSFVWLTASFSHWTLPKFSCTVIKEGINELTAKSFGEIRHCLRVIEDTLLQPKVDLRQCDDWDRVQQPSVETCLELLKETGAGALRGGRIRHSEYWRQIDSPELKEIEIGPTTVTQLTSNKEGKISVDVSCFRASP